MRNKKRSILISALAALIIVSTASASLMAGCGDNSASADEASVVVETKVIEKTINGSYYIDDEGNTIAVEQGTDAKGNIVVQDGTNASGNEVTVENGTDPQGNKVIEIKTDSSGNYVIEKSENDVNKENSSQSSNSNSGDSSKSSEQSSKSESSQSSKTESKSDNTSKSGDSASTLTIGGSSFSVGDTITCVYELTLSEAFENYQATIYYDSDYLTVENAEMTGAAESGSLLNYANLNNQIKFNGIKLNPGYNYKNGGEFMIVTYKVKASGSTSPKFEWEVLTGISEKAYVDNDGSVSSEIKLTETYSLAN